MFISNLDWFIIAFVLLISLVIGLISMKKAGKNANEYFAGGGNMPWWLLGISMVATTFSTDTPNLVTDIVRKHGVSGNWVKLLSAVIITTIAWVTATLISKPSDHETLLIFYNKIRPGGKGWNGFIKMMKNRGISAAVFIFSTITIIKRQKKLNSI